MEGTISRGSIARACIRLRLKIEGQNRSQCSVRVRGVELVNPIDQFTDNFARRNLSFGNPLANLEGARIGNRI